MKTVTEPSGKVTEYTYDEAGNRIIEKVTEEIVLEDETLESTITELYYEYDNRNRLVVASTVQDNELIEKRNYSYDENGNQLSTIVELYEAGVFVSEYTLQSNTYNERNELIETVTSDGQVIENAYNPDGLRSVKTVDGSLTRYLYEYDKVILEVDTDGNETGHNLYGLNLIKRSVEAESYYYLYNGHADVTALIDLSGEIVATYNYDSFGNVISSTGQADNSILYSGYQYDEETELYYINARMYDPLIARFLQEDTYGGNQNDPLSLNRYTYCHNNPIKYTDPSGHFVITTSILIGIGIGIAAGAIIGASIDAGSQMIFEDWSFEELWWDSIGKSAIEGAIAGGIGAAAGAAGVGLVATMAIEGATGFTANAISQKLIDGEVNWQESSPIGDNRHSNGRFRT